VCEWSVEVCDILRVRSSAVLDHESTLRMECCFSNVGGGVLIQESELDNAERV
jgi:hypothetical protein